MGLPAAPPRRCAWIITNRHRHTPITAAGMNPARKSATTEVFVTSPMTIIKIAGGTSMPIAVPDAISEALSSERYPARFNGGISVEPSAETSAIFEPQMSEKK
jgi:hypothetical protein